LPSLPSFLSSSPSFRPSFLPGTSCAPRTCGPTPASYNPRWF
jgi:hypothetical protein